MFRPRRPSSVGIDILGLKSGAIFKYQVESPNTLSITCELESLMSSAEIPGFLSLIHSLTFCLTLAPLPLSLLCSTLEIPFPNERLAVIAFNTMSVDKEPRRSHVTRELKVEGSMLTA